MGAGKSTVGRLVADVMNWRFVDLDEMIERRAGATIAEIFERDGEAAFRRLEAQALEAAAADEPAVIATGGGVMASAPNRELMARSGSTIWLAPPFEVLMERLEAAPAGVRPLLGDRADARRRYESRRRDYSRADHRLEIGRNETAAAVAVRVVQLVRGAPCAT